MKWFANDPSARVLQRFAVLLMLSMVLAACKVDITAGAGGNILIGSDSGELCPADCIIDTGDAAGESYHAVAESGYVFDHWDGDKIFCTEKEGPVCTINKFGPIGIPAWDDLEWELTAVFVEDVWLDYSVSGLAAGDEIKLLLNGSDFGLRRNGTYSKRFSGVAQPTTYVISKEDPEGYVCSLIQENDYSFNIQCAEQNQKPDIVNATPPSAVVGSSYNFSCAFSDPDNDKASLSVGISQLPDGLKFNASSCQISGTPTASGAGMTMNIRITVTDPDGLADELSFSLTVNPATPVISNELTQPVSAGSYSYTPIINNPNNSNFAFNVTGLPEWASFDSTTGTLSGTAVRGSYPGVTISAIDEVGGTVSVGPFTITVPNSKPQISGAPIKSINLGEQYSFTPTATDADGDPLTFTIENLPFGASFNVDTGEVSALAAFAGVFSDIVISVSDGFGGTASLDSFEVTVTAVPLAANSVMVATVNYATADGVQTNTLQITVLDANNTPMANTEVSIALTGTGSAQIGAIAEVTDGNGQIVILLSNLLAEDLVVGFTLNGNASASNANVIFSAISFAGNYRLFYEIGLYDGDYIAVDESNVAEISMGGGGDFGILLTDIELDNGSFDFDPWQGNVNGTINPDGSISGTFDAGTIGLIGITGAPFTPGDYAGYFPVINVFAGESEILVNSSGQLSLVLDGTAMASNVPVQADGSFTFEGVDSGGQSLVFSGLVSPRGGGNIVADVESARLGGFQIDVLRERFSVSSRIQGMYPAPAGTRFQLVATTNQPFLVSSGSSPLDTNNDTWVSAAECGAFFFSSGTVQASGSPDCDFIFNETGTNVSPENGLSGGFSISFQSGAETVTDNYMSSSRFESSKSGETSTAHWDVQTISPVAGVYSIVIDLIGSSTLTVGIDGIMQLLMPGGMGGMGSDLIIDDIEVQNDGSFTASGNDSPLGGDGSGDYVIEGQFEIDGTVSGGLDTSVIGLLSFSGQKATYVGNYRLSIGMSSYYNYFAVDENNVAEMSLFSGMILWADIEIADDGSFSSSDLWGELDGVINPDGSISGTWDTDMMGSIAGFTGAPFTPGDYAGYFPVINGFTGENEFLVDSSGQLSLVLDGTAMASNVPVQADGSFAFEGVDSGGQSLVFSGLVSPRDGGNIDANVESARLGDFPIDVLRERFSVSSRIQGMYPAPAGTRFQLVATTNQPFLVSSGSSPLDTNNDTWVSAAECGAFFFSSGTVQASGSPDCDFIFNETGTNVSPENGLSEGFSISFQSDAETVEGDSVFSSSFESSKSGETSYASWSVQPISPFAGVYSIVMDLIGSSTLTVGIDGIMQLLMPVGMGPDLIIDDIEVQNDGSFTASGNDNPLGGDGGGDYLIEGQFEIDGTVSGGLDTSVIGLLSFSGQKVVYVGNYLLSYGMGLYNDDYFVVDENNVAEMSLISGMVLWADIEIADDGSFSSSDLWGELDGVINPDGSILLTLDSGIMGTANFTGAPFTPGDYAGYFPVTNGFTGENEFLVDSSGQLSLVLDGTAMASNVPVQADGSFAFEGVDSDGQSLVFSGFVSPTGGGNIVADVESARLGNVSISDVRERFSISVRTQGMYPAPAGTSFQLVATTNQPFLVSSGSSPLDTNNDKWVSAAECGAFFFSSGTVQASGSPDCDFIFNETGTNVSPENGLSEGFSISFQSDAETVEGDSVFSSSFESSKSGETSYASWSVQTISPYAGVYSIVIDLGGVGTLTVGNDGLMQLLMPTAMGDIIVEDIEVQSDGSFTASANHSLFGGDYVIEGQFEMDGTVSGGLDTSVFGLLSFSG